MTDRLSQPACPRATHRRVISPRVRARLTRFLLAILAFVLIAPLVPYAAVHIGPGNVPNPGAELWNEVRQRTGPIDASTQARGVEPAVLINESGERWRQFRSDILVPGGAWLLLGTLGVLALFRLVRGRIPLEGGRSGKLVPRFSVNQRVVHWFTAFWIYEMSIFHWVDQPVVDIPSGSLKISYA